MFISNDEDDEEYTETKYSADMHFGHRPLPDPSHVFTILYSHVHCIQYVLPESKQSFSRVSEPTTLFDFQLQNGDAQTVEAGNCILSTNVQHITQRCSKFEL